MRHSKVIEILSRLNSKGKIHQKIEANKQEISPDIEFERIADLLKYI